MSEPDEPGDAPAASDNGRRSKLRSAWLRAARWTAAAVGFAATLLGLVFVLFPALKPAAPVTAPELGATVSAHPTAAMRTYGQFLDYSGIRRGGYDAATLGRMGIVVEFDYTITGYQNRPLPLRWELIDARQGDQLDQSTNATITSTAVKDGSHYYIWVPLPQLRTDPVYVAVQLLQPKDVGILQLGHGETMPLRLPLAPRSVILPSASSTRN